MLKRKSAYTGIDLERTYKRTAMLLEIYRNINWSVNSGFDEINDITYETCFGDKEALTYLLNFAPDRELDSISTRACDILQTRLLIEVINKAAEKIKGYPALGKTYFSILEMKYFSERDYSEREILTELYIERSTFYRKKKEAIYLLGYILFGFVLIELSDDKNRVICD